MKKQTSLVIIRMWSANYIERTTENHQLCRWIFIFINIKNTEFIFVNMV